MWNYEKIRSPHSERINRYIMECKYSIKKEYEDWKKELIDTLWNVNEGDNFWFCKMGAELIDTLWNVNNQKGK